MPANELANAAGVRIALLDNGAVSAIRAGAVLVSQVIGNRAEGGIGNVYLRRHTPNGVEWTSLVGPESPSRFRATSTDACWDGTFASIDYACALRLAPNDPVWFWTIRVTNRSSSTATIDLVLAQDVGLASEAAVRTSELYTSQYIDHTVLEDRRHGFLVCSRQNLPQEGGAAPWLMHGCLQGAAGYLTDGVQLYGLDYRATNVPAALRRPDLPNEVYQYELALPTLQSREIRLDAGESAEVTFFALFEADHPAASGADDARGADVAGAAASRLPPIDPQPGAVDSAPSRFAAPTMFQSEDLPEPDLEARFGRDWRHVERRDGSLLSYFHGEGSHVVLRAKELLVERPTGHIMLSGDPSAPTDDRLAVTSWMFGAFASQLTIGNTSFHKLLSVVRNPLNVLKSGGQRIFVRDAAGEELLGVPSAFEMAPTSARWIYQDARRTIVVRVWTNRDEPACRLTIDVERGGPLELVVTNDIVLGEHEGGPPGSIEIDEQRGVVRMRPASATPFAKRYPAATFFLVTMDPAALRAIELEGPHLVVCTEPVTRLDLAITGSVVDVARAETRAAAMVGSASAGDELAVARGWKRLLNGPSLGAAAGPIGRDLARLDDTLRWYAHNAVVHYVSPHGLEQSGGAAWGVRDVCQGPVEFLIATGNPGPVRDILRAVYEHQYLDTGDWPQWFMFDRYREIQQADSHGDVIHWPLKALCDYLEATNDLSILDEEVPYTDRATGAVTSDAASVSEHVERQVDRIERETIRGTALPIYGGGDWEDTLQPVDPDLARHLVSAWTTELAYQTLRRYAEVCTRAGRPAMASRLTELTDRIRADFNRYLVPDGVVAGLASFGGDDVEYFLHPRDRKTGVTYRLLPMTRGVISGLFTPDQARAHVELIERHLLFPDGARLMNRPMAYRGGTSRFFKRAESAANFGREVGLQYVHGHIRYVEAMAKLGRADAAFRGLMTVCPIGLEHDVPATSPRQGNAYFSSSDAAFRDRYEASREFDRLRTGEVGVKGGWRIYSSGPGIYINQLVANVLGLRRHFDDLVFDPVLPSGADGLTVESTVAGRPVRYRYHLGGGTGGPTAILHNGVEVGTRRGDNPFRPGGLLVSVDAFLAVLEGDGNEVDIVA